MFSKSKITQSMIDAVNDVIGLTEKLDVKKRTSDTLSGRVKISPTSGDNEHTDYKVELNAEETDKGESSTDVKGNKTTKYKDGSWKTETPTYKDDGKNSEGKVHHLSDIARRKMIKMIVKKEEFELDEVLDTFSHIKSYLNKNDQKRSKLTNSPENSISHPDYDKTANKIRKSFDGNNKVLNKLNKLNKPEGVQEESKYLSSHVNKIKNLVKHTLGKMESDKSNAKYAKEEVELDEARAKKEPMEVYHTGYSAALQHAEKHLNKQGYDIHPDDWQHHISHGPSKPSEGKTVQLHIPLHKDGVKSKKLAHIQVYNRGNEIPKNTELNMYVN